MIEKTALISGAGIAGSTLAYWLGRAGWDVTLVERAGGTRSSGNPIDVRGAAIAITDAMGLGPRLRAADTGVQRMAFVDAEGKERATLRTRRNTGTVEIARAALAAALLDAARPSAAVRFDDSIRTLHQDRSGVEVEFESSPPRRFGLIFGADGLHSTVRQLTFGPEQAFARPFGLFVGTMRTNVEITDPRQVRLYNEPNRLLSIHPAGGRALAAFIFRSDAEYDYREPHAGKALVENAYSQAGWIAPELLQEWRTAEEVYFDAVTRIDIPKWSRGRVALLGDAASCLSLLGEGSSNAIVAAKTLADAVAAHPEDHVAAFAEYERRHRTRIARYQRGSAAGSRYLVPATRVGISVRDRAMRIVATLASA